MAILEVINLKKTYTTRFGGSQVRALKNVNFTVENGEYAAVMGESGSGKTTLLNILAALDRPSYGTVLLDGRDITKLKDKELSGFRRDNLGLSFRILISWILFLSGTIFICLWSWKESITGKWRQRSFLCPENWESQTFWRNIPMKSPEARSSGRQ